MTELFGLWSCTGEPLDPAAHEPAWAALAACAGSPRAEVRAGSLWLSGPNAHTRTDPADPRAHVGFLLEDATHGLRGHFACARLVDGALVLERSISGGERLVWARLGPVMWFASSLRLLLAHPRIHPTMHRPALAEVLLTGRTCFGAHTLLEEVSEVMAGQQLVCDPAPGRPALAHPEALRMPEGDPDQLGRQLFERLTEAVAAAAGPSRPVPVALSGGIDSSAIAASAVEAFGADNVAALTYEFDDDDHPVETHYARQVCEHLGISHHDVFQLSPAGFVERIPEMVWRSENPAHWPKTFMLEIAEAVRARGFDRYLTGFGFGSHMEWMRQIGRWVGRLPGGALRRAWRRARFIHGGRHRGLHWLHPALEPPHPRIYHMMIRLLAHAGRIDSVEAAYPEVMRPLIEALTPVSELEPELEALDPVTRFQRVACTHMLSCIDVTRPERASRQLGVWRISPGHFTSTIAHAYFPPADTSQLTRAQRQLRPGKLLLRQAYAERLPDAVIYRIKSWADAVASEGWIQAGRVAMCSALSGFPADFDRFGPGWRRAVCAWEPDSILATCLGTRLWEALLEVHTPPTWDEVRDSS